MDDHERFNESQITVGFQAKMRRNGMSNRRISDDSEQEGICAGRRAELLVISPFTPANAADSSARGDR